MKTTTIITAVCIALLTFVTTKVQAQDSKVLAGVAAVYGSEIGSLGVSAKGVYLINDQWEAAASFTYFLPKKTFGFDLNWYSFDVDAHYVFSLKEEVTFYGLGGLNALMVSTSGFNIEGFSAPSSSQTNFGLNLGAGTRYGLSKSMTLVGEAKYTIASGGFFQIGAGILFAL